MNSSFIYNIMRFVVLIVLQLFLFDQIDFLGYIDPMVYVLFLVLFPVNTKPAYFLIVAFALGLILDTFQDSGGAHAAACITLAFTRPFWLRLVYGEGHKTQNMKLLRTPMDRLILFLILCVFVHHLIFFGLVIFNTEQIIYTLKLTLFVGLATVVVNSLLLILFKPKNR